MGREISEVGSLKPLLIYYNGTVDTWIQPKKQLGQLKMKLGTFKRF